MLEELFWGGRSPSDIVLPNLPLRTSLKQRAGSIQLRRSPLTVGHLSVLAPSSPRKVGCRKLQLGDLQPGSPTQPTRGLAASFAGLHAGRNLMVIKSALHRAMTGQLSGLLQA